MKHKMAEMERDRKGKTREENEREGRKEGREEGREEGRKGRNIPELATS